MDINEKICTTSQSLFRTNHSYGVYNHRLKRPVYLIFEPYLSVSMWGNQNLKIKIFYEINIKIIVYFLYLRQNNH